MKAFYYHVASDVTREALSLELIDEFGNVFAEVCRQDGVNHLKLNTFENDIDILVIEAFISAARSRLDPFEDGTPLEHAVMTQTLAVR